LRAAAQPRTLSHEHIVPPQQEHHRSMTRHKFKVGQVVNYNPNRMSLSGSSRGYEIKRLLPREGIEFLYRIKSPIETFERVVKEQELSRRDAT
jgi:hypothetical protein